MLPSHCETTFAKVHQGPSNTVLGHRHGKEHEPRNGPKNQQRDYGTGLRFLRVQDEQEHVI